eukprot:350618-Chlamydomonas_euryale.AAC.4
MGAPFGGRTPLTVRRWGTAGGRAAGAAHCNAHLQDGEDKRGHRLRDPTEAGQHARLVEPHYPQQHRNGRQQHRQAGPHDPQQRRQRDVRVGRVGAGRQRQYEQRRGGLQEG